MIRRYRKLCSDQVYMKAFSAPHYGKRLPFRLRIAALHLCQRSASICYSCYVSLIVLIGKYGAQSRRTVIYCKQSTLTWIIEMHNTVLLYFLFYRVKSSLVFFSPLVLSIIVTMRFLKGAVSVQKFLISFEQ